MEARVAKLEASVAHIERDVSELRTDMRDVRDRLAKLEERVSHLPTKGWSVSAMIPHHRRHGLPDGVPVTHSVVRCRT